MKLGVILSSINAETNWNAFRLTNLAVRKGDDVSVFLIGEGVGDGKNSSERFNIKKQVDKLLQSEKAKLLACGTCLDIRHKKSTKACQIGGIEDLYALVSDSDKVLTF
ncbi:MAG: DsrE family protein [Patescibacteria group bacterium]|nr:DsrE family protein [Patescibacteria group bacterium]